MPESRARTAICSAPFEWPSRPGLPTRIFGRRPSCSLQLRRPARAALPARRRRGAARPRRRRWGRGSCRTPRAACAPTRRWWRPRGRRRSSATIRFSLGVLARAATRASSASAASTAAWSRSERQRRTASICCGLDRRVDDEDAALGVGGQRRVLGLGEAVLADHDLLAGLDPPDALAVGVDQRAPSCRGRPRPRRRARRRPPSPRARRRAARRRARPSPWSPRRCRGTRGCRSRRPAPAGCAATTADPTAAAGRAPRSRPAAGSRGRGRRARA